MIHLKLIFWFGWNRSWSSFFPPLYKQPIAQHHLLKTFPNPQWIDFVPWLKINWLNKYGPISVLHCIPLIYLCEVKSLNPVRLFATPWTVAYRAPQYMEFSRQEYWSGLPFPSPGDLPNPRIKPGSPVLRTDVFPSKPPGKLLNHTVLINAVL